MKEILMQWPVPSSDGKREYTVTSYADGSFACSCLGWTRHMPRKDCRHIRDVRVDGLHRQLLQSLRRVDLDTLPVTAAPRKLKEATNDLVVKNSRRRIRVE